MREYSTSEISFLIQEGRGNSPEIREAIIRQYAPTLYKLAYALLKEEINRPGASLALTMAALRAALDSPGQLQLFDTPDNWLLSELLNQFGQKRSRRKLLGRPLSTSDWIIFLLRYQFSLSIPDIGEITKENDEAVLSTLIKHRNSFTSSKPPRGKHHIVKEINSALDGAITWQEADESQHLESCGPCRLHLGAMQEVEKSIQAEFSSAQPDTLSELAVVSLLADLEKPDQASLRPKIKPLPRETWWIAGAITAFLYISISLSSFWAPSQPSETPTPSLPEVEEVEIQLRDRGYEELERALLFSAVPSWHPGRELSGDWQPTTSIAFSSNGEFAGFGDAETLILWDLTENIQIPLSRQNSRLEAVSFFAEDWIAASDKDGTLHIWDIAEKKKRYILREDAPIREFSFSKINNILVTTSETSIAVWRVAEDQIIRIRQFAFPDAENLTVSQDGRLFAVTDNKGAVSVWRLSDYSFQLRFNVDLIKAAKIQFSPNGNRLAALGAGGVMQVFGFSQTADDTLVGSILFQLNHPGPVQDFTWLEEGQYLAALSEYSPQFEATDLMVWEMTTGLPATLPTQISNLARLNRIAALNNGQLIAADDKGTISLPTRSEITETAIPKLFNQGKTDIFPSDVIAQTTNNPFTQAYSSTLEPVSNLIALNLPLNDLIPDQYTFLGAAYDPKNEISSYKFSRAMAPNRDEIIVLRIRPIAPGEQLTLVDDWISVSAETRYIQIGRHLGELIKGEWVISNTPGDVPGILRWAETNTTRYRWRMSSYLYELVSESDIATEERRWNRFFQPLAAAIISGDQQIPIFEYIVAEGDTCIGLSTRFGTTILRLTTLNDLNRDCTIITGSVLNIPVPPPIGVFLESDLNCDGSAEQLRLIPAPSQPNTGVYFGMVMDALPEGANSPDAKFTTFDSFTLADANVAFFSPPDLVDIEEACGQLIAITGYGGTGEDSGLRFFLWTGEELRQVLKTNGFLDSNIFNSVADGFTFTTQRLEYDRTRVACNLKRTTFIWNNNAFSILGEEITPGVDCFKELLP